MSKCKAWCPCNCCEQRRRNIRDAELLKIAEKSPNPPYIVRGTPVMSEKFREQFKGKSIEFMIFDECAELEDSAFKAGQRQATHRIARLALRLAVYFLLSVGLGIFMLEVIS